MDNNTTIMALEVATNRLNWYIGLSVFASIVSIAAITITIIINKRQLKANHDWNRRSFTTAEIGSISKNLMQIRDELDILTCSKKEIIKSTNGKYINFTDRINQQDPLTPDEVHGWVCETDDQGKHIPSKAGKNPPCKTSTDGEKIINQMIEFINIYEQIGIALKNEVFDETIVKDAFRNPIKNNYKFYEQYIEHQIQEHDAVNFGASFKWLYNFFWEEKVEGKRGKTDS
ncbi:MAG: hypothetical protein COA44_06140 [Arcobacter sp.]|nr:MAG: hypothetical protein COA44_06140 [Arcobacter sp.]